MLLGIAKKNPDAFLELHNAALTNDVPTATRIANEIGLQEERFYAEGGGMWGWIVLAGVVIAVAALTTSDSPSPSAASAGTATGPGPCRRRC